MGGNGPMYRRLGVLLTTPIVPLQHDFARWVCRIKIRVGNQRFASIDTQSRRRILEVVLVKGGYDGRLVDKRTEQGVWRIGKLVISIQIHVVAVCTILSDLGHHLWRFYLLDGARRWIYLHIRPRARNPQFVRGYQSRRGQAFLEVQGDVPEAKVGVTEGNRNVHAVVVGHSATTHAIAISTIRFALVGQFENAFAIIERIAGVGRANHDLAGSSARGDSTNVFIGNFTTQMEALYALDGPFGRGKISCWQGNRPTLRLAIGLEGDDIERHSYPRADGEILLVNDKTRGRIGGLNPDRAWH